MPNPAETVILFAEDEAVVQNVLGIVLRKRGYQVLEAADGRQAMTLSEGYPGKIDLLLSNVNMPEMSGFDLADRITAKRPETKVLIISGNLTNQIESQNRGRHFLQKPCMPNILMKKVEEVLDSEIGPPEMI